MNSHADYTLAASLLALVFAGLIWTVGRQRWPRAVVLLIIAGVGGLLNTTAGHYAHQGVAAVETWMGELTGYLFGVIFAGIIAVVSAVILGFHWHHKTVGRSTLIAAGTLPLTATFVTGLVGTILIGAVSLLTSIAGWVFYFAFHGVHAHL